MHLAKLKHLFSKINLVSTFTILLILISGRAYAGSSWDYIRCIGVQNDAGPLKVTSAAPWYYEYGDWGKSFNWWDPASGVLGNSGWMNYLRSDGSWTLDSVKNNCKSYLPSNVQLNIIPVAQYTSLTYEWPLIEKNTKFYYLNNNKYFGSSASVTNPTNAQSFMNYDNLLTYAEAADFAYKVPETSGGNYGLQTLLTNSTTYVDKLSEYTVVGSLNKAGISEACAVALLSPDGKSLIISYKGTQSLTDAVTDLNLMIMNITKNTAYMNDYIYQAYNFYQNVHSLYSNATVILTGHSLGAFIANIIAMKTGEIARVFSSPANYIVNNTGNIFSAVWSILDTNYVPTPNVLNFARSGDPVVDLSGRHVSSDIFFPSTGKANFATNHSLEPFINLLKIKSQPVQVYLNPDLKLLNAIYDPITLQVNYQGYFPAPQ